jgi:hypothetical protein
MRKKRQQGYKRRKKMLSRKRGMKSQRGRGKAWSTRGLKRRRCFWRLGEQNTRSPMGIVLRRRRRRNLGIRF